MTRRLAFANKKKCNEFFNDQQVENITQLVGNVFPTAESPLELPRENSSASHQERGINTTHCNTWVPHQFPKPDFTYFSRREIRLQREGTKSHILKRELVFVELLLNRQSLKM